MDSSIHFYKKTNLSMSVTRRTFCAAAVAAPIAVFLPRAAFAETSEMQLMQSVLEPRGSDLFLSMSWEYDLPETLIDSLRRGIALYFVCEVKLQSKRWYWFDKDLGKLELVQRISFSPLTRQYRLSRGGLSQTYDTLEQILPITRHLIGWRIAESSILEDSSLELEVRMRLDASRLPKPLQVVVGGNSDWTLDSGWVTIDINQALKAKLF